MPCILSPQEPVPLSAASQTRGACTSGAAPGAFPEMLTAPGSGLQSAPHEGHCSKPPACTHRGSGKPGRCLATSLPKEVPLQLRPGLQSPASRQEEPLEPRQSGREARSPAGPPSLRSLLRSLRLLPLLPLPPAGARTASREGGSSPAARLRVSAGRSSLPESQRQLSFRASAGSASSQPGSPRRCHPRAGEAVSSRSDQTALPWGHQKTLSRGNWVRRAPRWRRRRAGVVSLWLPCHRISLAETEQVQGPH